MAITLAIPSRRFCAQRLPERGALNRRQSRTACDSLHQVRVTRSRGRVSAGRSLVAASSLALKIRRLAGIAGLARRCRYIVRQSIPRPRWTVRRARDEVIRTPFSSAKVSISVMAQLRRGNIDVRPPARPRPPRPSPVGLASTKRCGRDRPRRACPWVRRVRTKRFATRRTRRG
jgi:hypothetical protein